MLASILIRPGTIELREVPTPTPADGEILVKIKSSLTCGTDLKAFLRSHPMIPMPGLFGHEFSGVIAEVGNGVRKFKPGDEIMAVHSAPCLGCRYCKKKLYNLCEKIMDTKVLGAFAEYILLPSHIVRQNVFHKPKNITFEEAAFLEPLSCVVHGMESLDIKKGDHALVIGVGPIGFLHLLLLKEKRVKVAVTDIRSDRLRVAETLGADLIFMSNPPVPPFRKGGLGGILKGNLGGLLVKRGRGDFIGFDYVFECTGIPDVWEASVNYVRRGGTVILFGGCKKGTKVTYDTSRLHYDEITLRGAFHYTPADVKKAYKLLCEKRLDVSRLVSGRYPLAKIQKVFDKLAKGVGIKYAIIP